MYLNHFKIAYQKTPSKIADGVYAHVFPAILNRLSTGLVYPPDSLAKMVQIEGLVNPGLKTAFLLAGGNAHFAGLPCRKSDIELFNYQYQMLPLTLTQVFAHRQSQIYGDMWFISTDHSACASSLHVLMQAQDLLKNRCFDRVIVLGVEDAVSGLNFEFFSQAGVKPTEKISAFDDHYKGFLLGQGAVTCVFENERTNTTIAELLDVNSASESHTNSLGMREDGQGYVRAIDGLVGVDDVTVIKTHGTGTTANNKAERKALHSLFADSFVATSFKPTIGHTMGASGLLETCMLFEEIKKTGMVPAIKNRTKVDDVFLSYQVRAPQGQILSLAAGMGNIYTAALWEMV